MTTTKLKVGIILLCSVLLLTLSMALLPAPKKAAAQASTYSATWIDRTHIEVREGPPLNRTRIYTDDNLDDNYNFKDRNQPSPCQSELWTTSNSGNGDLLVAVTDERDRNCQLRFSGEGIHAPGEEPLKNGPNGRPLWDRIAYASDGDEIDAGGIVIHNTNAARINFRFIDDDTIEKVDGQQTLTRSTGNEFVEDGKCGDLITITGSQSIAGQTVRTGDFQQRRELENGACENQGSQTAYVTNRAAPDDDGNPGDDGAGADEEEEDSSCEASGVLTWFLCPVIKSLDESISFLDSRIQAMLTIPDSDYQAPELRATWARLRNIALIILVPIMLVMVIGTALGFDFISAYTVKRAIPRLVIAALFIVLSWTIVTFLIAVSNNVGRGVLGLMTASVGGSADLTLSSLFDQAAPGALFQALVTGGALYGTYVVASTAPGLILLFAGVVILALLVGFIVLTLRQLLILALAMVAPLAILAWIFPGNDKLWKLWWGTFSKLLIMFPLIELLIGSGRALAFVISETRTDFADSVVGVFFKILAWVLPYAFIFTTIKASNALLGAMTGGVFNLQERAREGLSARYGERGKDQLKARSLASRERMQNWADTKKDASAAKSGRSRYNIGGRVFRGAMSGASKGVGGYNLQAAISARRAAVNKEIGDQTASGDDSEVRAAFTDANLVDASRGGVGALERAGYTAGEDYRMQDGKLQLKNGSGNWYDASKAQSGQDRWGKDQHAMQKIASYEMYKSATEEEAGAIGENFLGITRSLGINDDQASGMWIGAAYENQNRLEYKHTKLRDGRMVLDGASFAKEMHEKKGTYDVSKMGSSTVDAMRTAHDQAAGRELRAQADLESAGGDEVARRRAQNQIDEARVTQQRIKETAATLTARSAGGGRQQGEAEDGQPIIGGGGGPAHVEQRIQELNAYVNGGGGGGRQNGPPSNGGVTPDGAIKPPSGGRPPSSHEGYSGRKAA